MLSNLFRSHSCRICANGLSSAATTSEESVDVTRLSPRHRIMMSGGLPTTEFEKEKSRSHLRISFGQFGVKSGVEMRKLWPSVEEVEEEEAAALLTEYHVAVSTLKESLTRNEFLRKNRIAELDRKLAKYPEVLKKYEAGQVKAEKERDEKEILLEKRIREIQEYFGYWMDPKDPRFEVLLKQKEQEEKKAEKLAKRLESQKKKIAEIL